MGTPDLAQVLDRLVDGVVLAGPDRRVQAVNTVAAALLGTSAAAAVGRPLDEVLALRDHEGRAWAACNTPYDGLSTRRAVPEQSWTAADGAEVLVTARLHRDVPRGPVTAVAVGLRSGRARARLDRDRSDLVATVAHELRSPLTGVKGFVQTLLHRWDRLSDDQRRLMLTTASVDADRLGRLVTELLDVARIDTGRLSLHPRPVDAVLVAERVVASVRAGTSRAVALDLDAVDGGPATVHADPDKLTQVLTNLLENGLRHGAGLVSLRLAPTPPGVSPAGVRAVVDDEGTGIPEEVRRRVFTKFWTQGTGGGSGLGMYVVHGLVRAHGGTVTIDDAPGGGARVVVDWPAQATGARAGSTPS